MFIKHDHQIQNFPVIYQATLNTLYIQSFKTVILTFYPNFIIQSNHFNFSRILHYCFDTLVQFKQIIKNQTEFCEILFTKKQQSQIFYTSNKQIAQNIKNILKSKLNQKGFYEQFKPIKKIGSGNFASVYLISRLSDKKKFAAKIFNKQSQYLQPKDKLSIQKQIEIMRSLNHQNIVKLYQVFQSQTTIFLVMQYFQGGRLHDLLKLNKKISNHDIQTIMKKILKGLEYLQNLNIIHRDIKPQNILFRKRGKLDCVLADFGFSTFTNQQYIYLRCGTPGYTSPEIINARSQSTKFSPNSDIFSLGIIFYGMLTGKKLFEGQTHNIILNKNRQSKILQKSEFELIESMLKKNPYFRIHAKSALQSKYFLNINSDQPDQQNQEIQLQNHNLNAKMLMANKPPKININQLNNNSQEKYENIYIKFNDSIGSFRIKQGLYHESQILTSRETLNEMKDSIRSIDTLKKSKFRSSQCSHLK